TYSEGGESAPVFQREIPAESGEYLICSQFSCIMSHTDFQGINLIWKTGAPWKTGREKTPVKRS
ncbi:MAG: hypothetical protein Q3X94_07120, partial [Oscillospiraceae bacterium]|nr:hypothetical protein [Oscillospiraceae bacterium]